MVRTRLPEVLPPGSRIDEISVTRTCGEKGEPKRIHHKRDTVHCSILQNRFEAIERDHRKTWAGGEECHCAVIASILNRHPSKNAGEEERGPLDHLNNQNGSTLKIDYFTNRRWHHRREYHGM